MRGPLMRQFTKEQHTDILTRHTDNKTAAVAYGVIVGTAVSPQNVAYWRKIFLDHKGVTARADNAMKNQRKLRKPEPDDDIGKLPDLNKVYHRVMVIPDQHIPYHHPDMLPFLAWVKQMFRPDLTVNLGDEVDNHALSFHDSDPNLDSAGKELERSLPVLAEFVAQHPKQLICASNHGSLIHRRAKAHGLPVQYIKSYRDILFPGGGAKGLSWQYEWIVRVPRAGGGYNEILFKHQSANATADAAHNRVDGLVVGHNHGRFEVSYAASRDFLYWGGTFGCLIDKDAMAFAYGKETKNKPIIGCGIILEGMPMLIPMQLDTNGRWVGGNNV